MGWRGWCICRVVVVVVMGYVFIFFPLRTLGWVGVCISVEGTGVSNVMDIPIL